MSTRTENEMILDALNQLGGNLVQEDALVFEGKQMILPATMEGDIPAAVKYLRNYQEQQETNYAISRTFRYRPNDGAAAFQRALKKIWGSTGIGRPIQTMFGSNPPEFRSIEIGVNESMQVPGGCVEFPPLKASIYIQSEYDREAGNLFHLEVHAPRKFRSAIEGLFTAIDIELQNESIYRGKAINGAAEPGFFDPFTTDPAKVVYSELVLDQLRANVWSLLENTQVMRDMRLPLKRTVLVEGPFGTGKSLSAQLTAQKAVTNGWTFVFCRPGKDDLAETFRTAQLYAPSVVFFEDIDVVAETGEPDAVSKLLEVFDGITSKGIEMVCMLTTNHVDRIHKAMLRPGRLDAIIHIGELDAAGFERLVKACVPAQHLTDDIDYAKVGAAFDGFLPSFAKEAIDRAMRYAIAREGAMPRAFTTEDFIHAADGLRPQLKLMNDANEGSRKPDLDKALEQMVLNGIKGAPLVKKDGGDQGLYLAAAPSSNGKH